MVGESWGISRTHKESKANSHLTKKKQVAAVGKINLLAQLDMLFLSPCFLQNEWTKDSHVKTKKCKDNSTIW